MCVFRRPACKIFKSTGSCYKVIRVFFFSVGVSCALVWSQIEMSPSEAWNLNLRALRLVLLNNTGLHCVVHCKKEFGRLLKRHKNQLKPAFNLLCNIVYFKCVEERCHISDAILKYKLFQLIVFFPSVLFFVALVLLLDALYSEN